MYNYKDYYYKKAKKDRYKARSIYKLEEIDKKYSIIKKNDFVLDIGCAPGSFLQYISRKIGKQGRLLGIDLKKVDIDLSNTKTYICDINDTKKLDNILDINNIKYFDCIVSDMAPNTTGIKSKDQYESYVLNMQVISIVQKYLKKNGNIVIKIFMSEYVKSLYKKLESAFNFVKKYKPKATRSSSFEFYIIAKEYKGFDILK